MDKLKAKYEVWGEEKPEPLNEKPITRERVTVWCAVGSRRILWPYFFGDDEGSAMTVNDDRYLKMLKSYYLPGLIRRGEVESTTFQHRGS